MLSAEQPWLMQRNMIGLRRPVVMAKLALRSSWAAHLASHLSRPIFLPPEERSELSGRHRPRLSP